MLVEQPCGKRYGRYRQPDRIRKQGSTNPENGVTNQRQRSLAQEHERRREACRYSAERRQAVARHGKGAEHGGHSQRERAHAGDDRCHGCGCGDDGGGEAGVGLHPVGDSGEHAAGCIHDAEQALAQGAAGAGVDVEE